MLKYEQDIHLERACATEGRMQIVKVLMGISRIKKCSVLAGFSP